MQKLIASYRHVFLVQDYSGAPIAILTSHDASQKEMDLYRQAHIPNGVTLRSVAEFLEEQIELTENRNRIAVLSKANKVTRQHTGEAVDQAKDGQVTGTKEVNFQTVRTEQTHSEREAALVVVNDIVNGLRGLPRHNCFPRKAAPVESAGERGKRMARAAAVALEAAQILHPKLEALLAKRKALDEDISKMQLQILQENSAKEAAIQQRNEEAAQAERGAEDKAAQVSLHKRWLARLRSDEQAAKAQARA